MILNLKLDTSNPVCNFNHIKNSFKYDNKTLNSLMDSVSIFTPSVNVKSSCTCMMRNNYIMMILLYYGLPESNFTANF